MVSHSILGLFILEISKLTFTLRPLHVLPAWLLSLDPLVMCNWWELCSFPQSEFPPPEEWDPSEVSLDNHGAPCLLCHLLLIPKCWEWAFFHSVPWLLASSFLTSASEASSSKPHIHSSMLYEAMGGLVGLCCSLGASWAPGLYSLFQDGICDGSMTFLDSAHHFFHLSLSPGQIDWAARVVSNIPCVTKGKPLFKQLSTHLPGAKTTASVILWGHPGTCWQLMN